MIGRIVSYPMTNGMIFTESYLAAADSALGLPHKIPNGMRAVSIKTTEVNDLGGFLYPGVRVDVLVAVKGADRTPGRSLALVQNVTVLATGKQLTPDPAGKPTEASVVTVLVTPEQAQKIVLAEEEGAIYFSLRNGGDNEVTDTKPTLLSEIAGIQSSPQTAEKHESLASEAPFPPVGTPIVTVLGNQSVTQFFAEIFRSTFPPPCDREYRTTQESSDEESDQPVYFRRLRACYVCNPGYGAATECAEVGFAQE